MSDQKPVVYLLHGEDEFSITSTIKELEKRIGDPAIASLNISHLDEHTSFDELRIAVSANPFITDRRIVVLYHPLLCFNQQTQREKFLAMLEHLPKSTALVLVEYTTLKHDEKNKKKNWLLDWAQKAGSSAYIKAFTLKGVDMAKWIQEQAKTLGGQFTPQAAELLASLVGEEKRVAYQEIQKLLTYADYQRAVQPEDVEKLTISVRQADIFTMVDALGGKDSQRALGILRRLLSEQDPPGIFGMVVRQFRLLLQVRDLMDRSATLVEIRNELKQEPFRVYRDFQADKLMVQARNFPLPTLENIYHRLLDIDIAIKRGQIEVEVALETFGASITVQ